VFVSSSVQKSSHSILQEVASNMHSSIKIVLYVDDLTIIEDNEDEVLVPILYCWII